MTEPRGLRTLGKNTNFLSPKSYSLTSTMCLEATMTQLLNSILITRGGRILRSPLVAHISIFIRFCILLFLISFTSSSVVLFENYGLSSPHFFWVFSSPSIYLQSDSPVRSLPPLKISQVVLPCILYLVSWARGWVVIFFVSPSPVYHYPFLLPKNVEDFEARSTDYATFWYSLYIWDSRFFWLVC